MNEYNDILPEDFENLEKYAPTLLAIGRRDGFVVPENYFEELPAHLQALLTVTQAARDKFAGMYAEENYFMELQHIVKALLAIDTAARDKNAGLTNPGENYFDELTAQIEALNRLNAIAGDKKPYELPADYFNQLNDELLTKLALDNLKQDKEKLFAVPDGYFDQLAGKMQSFAALEQMKEGDEKDVPEDYFSTFASRVQARIAAEEKTGTAVPKAGKIISFSVHFSKNVRTYSAAAALLLVLGAGYVWYNSVTNGVITPGNDIVKNDTTNVKQKQQGIDTNNTPEISPKNIANNNTVTPNNTPVDTTKVQQPDLQQNPVVQNDVKKDSVKTNNDVQFAVNTEMPAEFDAELQQAAIDYLMANEADLGELLDEIGSKK